MAHEKSIDEQIASQSEFILLDPTFSYAFGHRGQLYLSKGDYERALADFSEAIRLCGWWNPGNYCNRGDCYRRKGDYERAFADFSEVIRRKPEYSEAFQGRGNCHRMKADYERAIADLSEAIRINPKYSWALGIRGECYRMKGDYERAIADLSEAVRLDPTYSWALGTRGECYRMKGDYERAIADLSEAIRLDPKYSWALGHRGECYRMKGDYERAIADLSEAIRLDPKNSWAIDVLSKTKHANSKQQETKQTTKPVPPTANPITAQRHYLDCPNCGKYYAVDQVNPQQRIDCSNCDGWFLVKDALNLRTTRERVETKGFFQRLWSGSSIERSNREQLVSRAETYQSIIRNEMLKGNHAAAQVWQLKLNEIMRQIDNL